APRHLAGRRAADPVVPALLRPPRRDAECRGPGPLRGRHERDLRGLLRGGEGVPVLLADARRTPGAGGRDGVRSGPRGPTPNEEETAMVHVFLRPLALSALLALAAP